LFRLAVVVIKTSGFSLDNSRLPDGSNKAMLLRAIELSLAVLPLRVVLRLLRLSPSRYHSWKMKRSVVSMTCLLVHEDRHSNSHPAR
jgi:hypothetical protein